MADLLFCAKRLDWDAPVTEVQGLVTDLSFSRTIADQHQAKETILRKPRIFRGISGRNV